MVPRITRDDATIIAVNQLAEELREKRERKEWYEKATEGLNTSVENKEESEKE